VLEKIKDIDSVIQNAQLNKLKYTENPQVFNAKYNLSWKDILEPPPLNNSSIVADELSYLSRLTSNISQTHIKLIKKVDKDPKHLFNETLLPRGLAFPDKTFDEYYNVLDKYILNVKHFFNRVRPEYLGKIVGQKINVVESKTTKTPAYPSGHTCYAALACILCSRLYPNLINEFKEHVRVTAYCREMQGVHFPSDNAASIIFTEEIFEQLQKILG
jgi:hypothetical protein